MFASIPIPYITKKVPRPMALTPKSTVIYSLSRSVASPIVKCEFFIFIRTTFSTRYRIRSLKQAFGLACTVPPFGASAKQPTAF
jgi:hypothetical protein